MNEYRILRDRHAALSDAIDRADVAPPAGADRRLIQTFKESSYPTAADKFYACHPVVLNGPESEGIAATSIVDTSTTLYVDFLRSSPPEGSYAVATAAGGRWVAEIGGACVNHVCVFSCGTVPVFGALVQVFTTGGTLVVSCTTDATGCCPVNLCGSYRVKVTVGGTLVFNAIRTLANGVDQIVPLASAGIVCCGSYAIPKNLTLTDAAGSLSFVYDPSFLYPIWYGGHAVNETSCTVSTPGGICISNPASSGPVRICYQMICDPTNQSGCHPRPIGTPGAAFCIQRAWSWVFIQGTLTPIWYQDATGFASGLPCATAPPASCGSPLTDTGQFDADPSSSSPFVLTGTPVAFAGNATADPVGGSITVSA